MSWMRAGQRTFLAEENDNKNRPRMVLRLNSRLKHGIVIHVSKLSQNNN